MAFSLGDIRKDVEQYEAVTAHVLNDISFGTSGDLLYNLDFAVLFPYIWPIAPKAVTPFKPYGRWVFGMLTQVRTVHPEFNLVFTGASFWELLDSFYHQVKRLEQHAYSAKSRHSAASQLVEKRDLREWREALIKTGMAARDLQLLSERGYQEQITRPIKVMLELLENGPVLRGLGDIVTDAKSFAATYRKGFDELLNAVCQRRAHNPNELRPREDRLFHYKVDTANILASMAINTSNDSTRLFMTSDSDIRGVCPARDARSPLVPFCWVSAMLLEKEHKYFSSTHDFFGAMHSRAAELRIALDKAESLEDLGGFTKHSISDFYEVYVGPLLHSKKPGDTERDAAIEHEFQELVSDPKKFKDHLSKARDELIEGGRELAALEPNLLHDGLYELLGGEDDPIVERIRSMFNVG